MAASELKPKDMAPAEKPPVGSAPTSRWRRWRRRMSNRLGYLLGPSLLRLLVRSWRITVVDVEQRDQAHQPDGGPVIVFWHQQILTSVGTHLGFPVSVLMSHHRDGALVAHLAQHLGYGVIRGSSSAGGVQGLRDMLRAAQGPDAIAITPDGPRGPYHHFAPGVFFLAARLKRPLVATGYAASRYWQAGGWDRMIIPKPFARVVVAYRSLPAPSPRAAKAGPEQEALAESLRAAMAAAEAQATETLAELT